MRARGGPPARGPEPDGNPFDISGAATDMIRPRHTRSQSPEGPALPKTTLRPAEPRAPARRKRRTAEDLRSRILLAAGEEFRRCGYAGATTAAIARQADVTEAHLFRYFASRAALFREAIFKPLDQQLSNFVETHMLAEGVESVRETSAL